MERDSARLKGREARNNEHIAWKVFGGRGSRYVWTTWVQLISWSPFIAAVSIIHSRSRRCQRGWGWRARPVDILKTRRVTGMKGRRRARGGEGRPRVCVNLSSVDVHVDFVRSEGGSLAGWSVLRWFKNRTERAFRERKLGENVS